MSEQRNTVGRVGPTKVSDWEFVYMIKYPMM